MFGLSKPCTVAISAFMLVLAIGIPSVAAQDADMAQIDAIPGGLSTVFQSGNRNDAVVRQLAAQPGMDPGRNHALITQSGDDNHAEIAQEGGLNSASIAQSGSNNEGAIMQMNSHHGAELQQSGNGLSIKIEQYGAGIPGNPPVLVKQGN
jgi:minor curlin subunit